MPNDPSTSPEGSISKKPNLTWQLFPLLRNNENNSSITFNPRDLFTKPFDLPKVKNNSSITFKPTNLSTYIIFQKKPYPDIEEKRAKTKNPKTFEISKEQIKIGFENNIIPFAFYTDGYYELLKNNNIYYTHLRFELPTKEEINQKTFMISLGNTVLSQLSNSIIFTNIEQSILYSFNTDYYEPKIVIGARLNRKKNSPSTFKNNNDDEMIKTFSFKVGDKTIAIILKFIKNKMKKHSNI
jgi:hypothetical protein